MTKYLISFPSDALKHFSLEELQAASVASHAVVQEAKDAGVWVFGGGINEDIPAIMVSGEGAVTHNTYPQTKDLNGGFTILEVRNREEAMKWAIKMAASCGCAQELREFHYSTES